MTGRPVGIKSYPKAVSYYHKLFYVAIATCSFLKNISQILGSKAPFNLLTPVIDGNTIYGVDETFSRYLRSGFTGQLRMNPAFANLGLKELLPMKLNIPDEGCIRENASQYCFESGWSRVLKFEVSRAGRCLHLTFIYFSDFIDRLVFFF